MATAEEPMGVIPDWATTAGRMLFKVDPGEKHILSEVTICNKDAAARIVAIFHVPDGEVWEDKYSIFDATVKAKQTVEGGRGKVFHEGDELWVVTDEDDVVTCSCSYSRRYTP